MTQHEWVDSEDEVKKLGKYEVGKKIAEGTYGSVYDIVNSNKVAKLLRHRSADQESREIDILQALRNTTKSCIQLEAVKKVGDHTYLIFEKCPIDLDKAISTGTLMQLSTVKWLMQTLLRGLAEMHHLGILHR